MKRFLFILLASALLFAAGCAHGAAEPSGTEPPRTAAPEAVASSSPAPTSLPSEAPNERTNFLLTDSEPVRYLIVPYVDDGALPTRFELDETERAELWAMLCDLDPTEEVPRPDDEELAYRIYYVSDEHKHNVNIWPGGVAQFGGGSAVYVCDGVDYDLLTGLCERKFSMTYAPDDPEKAAKSFKAYFNEVAEDSPCLTELWFDPDVSNRLIPVYCHDSMIVRCRDERNVLALCFSYNYAGSDDYYTLSLGKAREGFHNAPPDRPVVAFMERESENDSWYFALWSDVPVKHLVSSCDKQMFID